MALHETDNSLETEHSVVHLETELFLQQTPVGQKCVCQPKHLKDIVGESQQQCSAETFPDFTVVRPLCSEYRHFELLLHFLYMKAPSLQEIYYCFNKT